MDTPKQIDNGGPAFPIGPKNLGFEGSHGMGVSPGMTLRDWFAGQALAGWLASPIEGPDFPTIDGHAKHAAESCYLYADAMIAARKCSSTSAQ